MENFWQHGRIVFALSAFICFKYANTRSISMFLHVSMQFYITLCTIVKGKQKQSKTCTCFKNSTIGTVIVHIFFIIICGFINFPVHILLRTLHWKKHCNNALPMKLHTKRGYLWGLLNLSPDLGIYEVHPSFFKTKLLQGCRVSLKSNIGSITLLLSL